MAYQRVTAFAPATVANLGVGFDILGLAVAGLGDTVIVERRAQPGAIIEAISGDEGRLPRDAGANVATVSANALLLAAGSDVGVSITLQKGLPIGSGLGSSAASSVAPVVAVNHLLGEPFKREELLAFCLEGEKLVSGEHADNVGPALLGGITLITGTDISQIRPLPVPDDLHLALVTPDVVVPTLEARAALPAHIPMRRMVHQTGAVARVIDALYRGDVRALAAAMEADEVVEPARSHLMPLLDAVRFAAKRAGALALVISGAGPTLCAVCEAASDAERVAEAMRALYADENITATSLATRVLKDGAQLLDAN